MNRVRVSIQDLIISCFMCMVQLYKLSNDTKLKIVVKSKCFFAYKMSI